jgi:hypothetical protein
MGLQFVFWVGDFEVFQGQRWVALHRWSQRFPPLPTSLNNVDHDHNHGWANHDHNHGCGGVSVFGGAGGRWFLDGAMLCLADIIPESCCDDCDVPVVLLAFRCI